MLSKGHYAHQAPILEILEYRSHHGNLELRGLQHFEVFVARQIQEKFHFLKLLVQRPGDRSSPEFVKIVPGAHFQLGTHFEAIGLNEIERPQQSVLTRKDPQLALQLVQVRHGHGGHVQSTVHLAGERVNRLFGIIQGKGKPPALISFVVQPGQLVGDGHPLGQPSSPILPSNPFFFRTLVNRSASLRNRGKVCFSVGALVSKSSDLAGEIIIFIF